MLLLISMIPVIYIVSPAVLAGDKAPALTVKSVTDREIKKNRMGTIIIKASSGEKVSVRMLKHEFLFGSAFSQRIYWSKVDSLDRAKYFETFRNNFNFAVHGDALKWHAIETERGKPNYSDADRILSWCEENGIPMRGHCIFWDYAIAVPDWAKALDDQTLLKEMERRAKEVTSRYRGKIKEYDLNNEMIHGGYFEKRFGDEIVLKMAQWAHEGDPAAVFYVNDFNIMNGKHLERYSSDIEKLLKMGVPIGGIGIQGHLEDTLDPVKIKTALDTLSKFKLPIKITEFDFDCSDEETHAEGVENFFRICFAHPSVTGIVMWGFWAGDHWRPRAALWNKDWSPKLSGIVYRNLVFGEWQTNCDVKADKEGNCIIPAFFGLYSIKSGGVEKTVELKKSMGTIKVEF